DTLNAMGNVALAYMAVAARQAWFGQDQEFADTCRRALEFAAGTKDPVVADRIAKTCSLRYLADPARRDAALTLAKTVVQLGTKISFRAWFPLTLGMAEYRGGHFAEADTVLAAAIA